MKRYLVWLVKIVHAPISWTRAMGRRERLESEMEAELASHLDYLTADLVRAGQSHAEARRNARLALGSPIVFKDGMRRSLGLRLIDEARADANYGFRLLQRSPGFTCMAAISLALAIGANTTIFSLVKQLLLERLAVPRAAELRLLTWRGDDHVAVHDLWGDWDHLAGNGITSSSFSYPVFRQMAAHSEVTQGLAAFKDDHMNATVAGEAAEVQAEMVSGNFYSVMELRPQLGRGIQPSDDAVPGSGAVAVISDGLWSRRFGHSTAVIGQTIKVNEAIVTIVGVNPRGFTGAKGVQQSPDVYLPMSMQPIVDPKGKTSLLSDQEEWWVNVMARARAGIPDSQARAALAVSMEAAVRATTKIKAKDTLPRLELSDGSRGMHETDGMFKKPVLVLMTFTVLVLLLACANVASLMLARGAKRQREMSVRLALGAGRARILRQLLTESMMLAALGGAGGLALGYVGRNLIPALMSRGDELHIPFDWGVYAFSCEVTLCSGLLFGMAPAWAAARSEVSTGLKESAQTASKRRRGLGGKSIVGFQVALSTMLVIASLLFLRTVSALYHVDIGFRTDHLLLFSVNPPARLFADGKDVVLHRRLEQAFAAIPGVESVTAADPPFLSGSVSMEDFVIEGEKSDPDAKTGENVLAVGNDFFRTLEIPILAGRGFGSQDTANSTKVAVINQQLAKSRFPNVNPIGRRFKTGNDSTDEWMQIIGVCADTRYSSLRDEKPAQFLVPWSQAKGIGGLTYEVRTRVAAASLAPSLRQALARIDPDLPMVNLRTQQEQIDEIMQMEEAFAALLTGFGVLALALACVGIYGVMAYSVANRTNEIGVRLALGAIPRQILGMILRESAWISVAGVAVGLGAALLLARLIKSMLYGLQPTDPVSLAGGAALLLVVGLAASWIPARRAAGVEPMEALRHE